MSKHCEILPEVVAILQERFPGCAILLNGSVARGAERPDSDLDLIVIHDGDEAMRQDHSWIHAGVEMCMTYFGDAWLTAKLRETPYWFWPLTYAKVLTDPSGLGEKHRAVGRAYFESHPEAAQAWETKVQAYHDAKAGSGGTESPDDLPGFLAELGRRFGD